MKKNILADLGNDILAYQPFLEELKALIRKHNLNDFGEGIILTRCLNEGWFSDSLAWLMDPKGSHLLGLKFTNEFLKLVAKVRSQNDHDYTRKNSMLKWGKSGSGTSAFSFSLKNASVIREFYLAKSINKRDPRGTKYCDIVLIDLDASDGLFLVIENKLFTSNHPSQLEQYYDVVEDKYKRAKIREYVYLTINGSEPMGIHDKYRKRWLQISWIHDILPILEKLTSENEHPEVTKIRSLLQWLKKIKTHYLENLVEALRILLLQATAICLDAELERLGEGKTGSWEIKKIAGTTITIYHSSFPKTPLFIELLPNLSITVQSRRKDKPLFEKIIVPYGANVDQIYNLLDIAARDIYHYHFAGNVERYMSGKRRLTATQTIEKEKLKPLFEYIAQNSGIIKVMFIFSKNVWLAQKHEMQETL